MNTVTLLGSFLAVASIATIQMPLRADTASQVSVVSSMDKFRRDERPPYTADEVNLHAARGDAENQQIIISAIGEDIRELTIEASPLKSPDGSELLPEVNLVGYMMIHHPTPDGYGVTGEYPDILHPLSSFEVTKGNSQAIWYAVWVPRDATPGDYQGEVTVRAGENVLRKINVSLKVYSAVLPKQSILRTAFGYGPWELKKPLHYGKHWTKEKEEAFFAEMVRYRLTPVNADIGGTLRSLRDAFRKDSSGNWVADWAEVDQEIAMRLEQGWSQFNLTYLPLDWYSPDEKRILRKAPNRWQELTEDDQAQLLRLMNDHLVEKGWVRFFAFKCFDEPSINPENIALMRKIGALVHANAPNLRLLMITTDTRERNLALEYPLWTWVPHLPSLSLAPGYEEFLHERQKKGEQAWTYICDTRMFHDNTILFPDIAPPDRTGTSQRSFGSLAWRNRLDGFLYWNVTEWSYREGYGHPDHLRPGEGVLFHPDFETYAIPLASIRVALVRDGFEDHDLLYLLNQKVKTFSKNKGLSADQIAALKAARELLDVQELIPNLRDFNRDPSAFENHHKAVLQAYERLVIAFH